MSAVSCFDRAVKLLSLRTHFELELRSKLAHRGYPSSEVDDAIERCRDLGYLDDAKAALELARTKRSRSGWGRKKLEAELRRRGASGAAVVEALDDEGDDDELRRALEVAEKAARRRDDRQSIARHLSRKGYGTRVILTVLERRGLSGDEGL